MEPKIWRKGLEKSYRDIVFLIKRNLINRDLYL